MRAPFFSPTAAAVGVGVGSFTHGQQQEDKLWQISPPGSWRPTPTANGEQQLALITTTSPLPAPPITLVREAGC